MKRLQAYLLMGVPYLLGFVAAWFVFAHFAQDASHTYSVLLGLFLADLCATFVVWLFGVVFKNSSFYDAYWSVAPLLLVIAVIIRFELFSAGIILFVCVFAIWSIRLTLNWAYTCKSLRTEDWRYAKYRADNKMLMWHIINFFGINFMPTLIVFAALIPAVYLLLAQPAISAQLIIGALIILLGTALEMLADNAMHKFKMQQPDSHEVLQSGLWAYSRHPNYLGEILIWLGVYVCALPYGVWWFAGFLGMVLLFNVVSIPLAEKRHLSRRPAYADYKASTSRLLILPKKKK